MKSPLVSTSLMEATWQRVGGSTGREAQRLQQATGKEQEELTGFVIGYSSRLGEDALGMVLYLYVVIAEAFRRSGAKFRKVTPAKILHAWDSAEKMAAALKQGGRYEAEQHAESTAEPAVFRYVVEAMNEESNSEPVYLTDEEFWHILCILTTASECLHDATKNR